MSCHNTPPDSSRLVGQALIAPTQPGPHPLSVLPTPPRGQLPTIPVLVIMPKGDRSFDLYHFAEYKLGFKKKTMEVRGDLWPILRDVASPAQ